jgi:hypothetical protein
MKLTWSLPDLLAQFSQNSMDDTGSLDGYLSVDAFSALQEQLNRLDIDGADRHAHCGGAHRRRAVGLG